MALKIRLRQQGRNNHQTYRVVVTDSRNPRDGKYIEMLGWYNPTRAQDNTVIDADRFHYWVSQGAEVSERVQHLAVHAAPRVIEEMHSKRRAKQLKMTAKRRALKAKKNASAKK